MTFEKKGVSRMATATAAGEEQKGEREHSGEVQEPGKTGLGLPEGEALRRRTEGTEVSKAAMSPRLCHPCSV